MTSSGEGVRETEESVDQNSEGFQHFSGEGRRRSQKEKVTEKKRQRVRRKISGVSVPLRSFLLKRKFLFFFFFEKKVSKASGKQWTANGPLDKVVEAFGNLREKHIDDTGKRSIKTIVHPPCY